MWKTAAVLLLTAIAVPCQALAWGAEGHRIIAVIAADRLSPAARQQISAILGDDPKRALQEASNWADEIRRSRHNTAPWHYVNIPAGSSGYVAVRDCPRDDCVVTQIERDERIIADRHLLAPVRAEALRFLIHFIGDVHQPLHAADNNDRGGNEVRVVLGTRRTNLHAVWDSDVVRALGRGPESAASALERQITDVERNSWESGGPATWANESWDIARREIYRGLPGGSGTAPVILPRDYAKREERVAASELMRAGVRL